MYAKKRTKDGKMNRMTNLFFSSNVHYVRLAKIVIIN